MPFEDKTVLELFKDYININKRIRTEKRKLKFINKIIKISKKYGYKLYRNDIDKEKSRKIIIMLEEE